MSRDLDFIVAMTREGVIGKHNALPWRLPQDLKRFRSITTGNSVIMGRKTFESIGQPLKHMSSRASPFAIPGMKSWIGRGARRS
jgi:dihydrofolate reductase